MLKIEKTVLPSAYQWEIVIEGMRNPKNSWHLSDSVYTTEGDNLGTDCPCDCPFNIPRIGEADLGLMKRLNAGGAVHAKYRRMIPVFITVNAPLYWWKEFDTYKVGTVCNSCSTMHKIHSKEFTLDDFSHDHLERYGLAVLENTIETLNIYRDRFNKDKDKNAWYNMIQLLPTSYNQRRTIMLNYEVLVGMYRDRKNHKLQEWHTFCDWIRSLPYSELITGEEV